jgi:hypothetical protein
MRTVCAFQPVAFVGERRLFVMSKPLREFHRDTEDDLFTVSLDLDPTVRTDMRTAISLQIASSVDGRTWQPIAKMVFRGSPTFPASQWIGLGQQTSQVLGKRIAATVESSLATGIGVTMRTGSRASFGV